MSSAFIGMANGVFLAHVSGKKGWVADAGAAIWRLPPSCIDSQYLARIFSYQGHKLPRVRHRIEKDLALGSH